MEENLIYENRDLADVLNIVKNYSYGHKNLKLNCNEIEITGTQSNLDLFLKSIKNKLNNLKLFDLETYADAQQNRNFILRLSK